MALEGLGGQAVRPRSEAKARPASPSHMPWLIAIVCGVGMLVATGYAIQANRVTDQLVGIREQECEYIKSIEEKRFAIKPAVGMKFYKVGLPFSDVGEECSELVFPYVSDRQTKSSQAVFSTHAGGQHWEGPWEFFTAAGELGVVDLARPGPASTESPAEGRTQDATDARAERRRLESMTGDCCRILIHVLQQVVDQDPAWWCDEYDAPGPVGIPRRTGVLLHPAGMLFVTVSPHFTKPDRYVVDYAFYFASSVNRGIGEGGAGGITLHHPPEPFRPKPSAAPWPW